MRKFTAALLAMGCIVGVTSTYALPVQTNLKKEVVVKAITSKPVETIGEKEAGKIGNKIAPVGAKYDDTRLVVVGDKAYYQVRYLGENSSFIATIDAYTGKVVTTNQNNAIIKDQQTANRVDGSTAYIPHLSEQKAIEIANNQFLHGKTVKNELVKKDGYWVYEVTIQEGDYLSKVYVNPENSQVEQIRTADLAYSNQIGSEVIIDEQKAKNEVEKYIPKDSKYESTTLKIEGGRSYYEVVYTQNGIRIVSKVDVTSGKVVEIAEGSTIKRDPNAENKVDGNKNYIPTISEVKASQIASEKLGNGQVEKTELVQVDGYWVYAVTVKNGEFNSVVYVNPENAKVEQTTSTSIWKPSEEKPVFDPNKPILDQIKDLIGGKLPEGALGNGKVTEFELDADDGKTIAEITFISGGIEYEFEIDTVTGHIIDMEMEEEDDEDEEDDHHKKPIITPVVKPNKDNTASSSQESKKETSSQVQHDDDDDDEEEDDD